jgi:hypothetical protein
MLPSNPNIWNQYNNFMNNVTFISGNEYIESFGFHVNSFSMERNYDYLSVYANAPQILTGGPSYGNNIAGWYDFRADMGGSLPTTYMNLMFNSDYSVSDTGVFLDQAEVCTNNPGKTLYNAEGPLVPYYRTSGVLLGTGDVAYFNVPVGSAKSGDTCSSAHDTFAMWGGPNGGPNGVDFDLYVRCNAQPTNTQWDYRGFSSDPQEFIHATTDTCPCGSYWHVAVQSFRGAGWFNLVNHKHYASEHRSEARVYAVTFHPPIPNAQLNAYATEMSRGVKHFFGANEGARYWDGVGLYQATNTLYQEINIYADVNNGRPNSDRCASGSWYCFLGGLCELYLYNNWFDGPTLSHELGHHLNCLDDEYDNPSQDILCGHSIMASQFYTNSNYCWCTNQQGNMCASGYGDHGRDTTPLYMTSVQTGAAWSNLASRAPYQPITMTPDNYDYTQFDFDGLYGTVTIH